MFFRAPTQWSPNYVRGPIAQPRRSGSFKETFNNFETKLVFTVFGDLPICFSKSDAPFFFLFILSAYKISDSPDWSFVTTICLLARKRSLIVLITRSILLLPLWLRTGQVLCSISNCLQNFVNSSLSNTVPGPVLVFLSMPYCAIYCFKNSTVFSVVGHRKNFASGKPEKNRETLGGIFSPHLHFGTIPQNLVLFPHFVFFAFGIFPYWFGLYIHFKFLPDFKHSSHRRAWSITFC